MPVTLSPELLAIDTWRPKTLDAICTSTSRSTSLAKGVPGVVTAPPMSGSPDVLTVPPSTSAETVQPVNANLWSPFGFQPGRRMGPLKFLGSLLLVDGSAMYLSKKMYSAVKKDSSSSTLLPKEALLGGQSGPPQLTLSAASA